MFARSSVVVIQLYFGDFYRDTRFTPFTTLAGLALADRRARGGMFRGSADGAQCARTVVEV